MFILNKKAFTASTKEEIKEAIEKVRELDGPILLEIKCSTGSRKNLGRPKSSPVQNKSDFMHFLALS